MGEQYDALIAHLSEIQNINMAASVLNWDHQTQMPPGGAASRASQLATLSRIGHEMLTSDTTGRLLQEAATEQEGAAYESDEAGTIRVMQEDYVEALKLPTEFVSEFTRETSLAHHVWAKAREDKDFSQFQSTLEKLVDLALQMAEYLGYEEHPYDALINQYERGITTAQVKDIFDAHKPSLVELIAAISENADKVDDSILRQPFDIDKQREFGLRMVKAIGFDFDRGVQAVSVHPFCTHFSTNDVRITTRFEENWLNPALFGMLHEAGHAMYEQGVSQSLEGTPMASGTSLGVHESQSRTWENIVGRSKGFWKWALPQLKEVFPGQFDGIDLDTFYKSINKVAPSFIRVEADEATYNLHIILRFEIETGILAGNIKMADLPDVWNSLFDDYFGIVPPDDAIGVLQDVHWSAGLMGYFPTYALGNLLSAQYYSKALSEHPSIPEEIEQGKFDTLLRWSNENIHKHGRKFTSDELTRHVTGESIQSQDYMQYLQDKFGEIYGL